MRRLIALCLLAGIPFAAIGTIPPAARHAVGQESPALPTVVAPTTPQAPTPTLAPPAPFDATIKGPTKASGAFWVTVTTMPGAVNTWRNEFPTLPAVDGEAPKQVEPDLMPLADGRVMLMFQETPRGLYLFRLHSQLPKTDGDGLDPYKDVEHAVIIGGGTPVVEPVDPTVPADPSEPLPPDDASTAKVKTPGFRCLLLCEKKNGIPTIFADPAVRSYLATHCAKGADGVTPDWRLKDNDEPATGDYPVWKLYRETLPDGSNEGNFVSCGNGVIGYAGPAPATGAELLALLKKYGGA